MTLFRFLPAVLALTAGAAIAQTAPFQMPRADDPPPSSTAPAAPDDDSVPGGIDTILQNLLNRAQPHLEGLARDLETTFDELSPAFQELSGLIDDIGNYQRPERLENGDILIRRRPDAPPPPPLEDLQNLLPRDQGTPEPPPTVPVDPAQPEVEL